MVSYPWNCSHSSMIIHNFHKQTLLFLVLLSLLPYPLFSKPDKVSQAMLEELDQYISVRETYDVNKHVRIDMLMQMSVDRYTSSNQLYSIYSSLADEYYTYSFDSTVVYIHKCMNQARKQKNKNLIDESNIRLGMVYASSGHYLEASNLLLEMDIKQIDSSLYVPYYTALHRLVKDLGEYTSFTDAMADREKWVTDTRNMLFHLLSPNSIQYMDLQIEEYLEKREYQMADSLNHVILSRIQLGSHDYAKFAYIQSLIEAGMEKDEAQLQWLIRSAKADIQNAIKDYASLATIATYLFNHGDIDRAFQYEQICMWDAMYYNARLRQWQVATSIPVIEKAYQDKQRDQKKRMSFFIVVISVLSLILFLALAFIINRTGKLDRTRKDLKKMNDFFAQANRDLEVANRKYSELNKEISEANAVKEEYIGLFLGILSDNIDKLKDYESMVRKKIKYGRVEELMQDLSRSNLIENEMAAFYQTFDNAFLTLYPNFVDEFNSLLTDDGKILPKKGEILNTELRIFALIRLGIEDSSKIAALLRYSVNTIYNYRAKVKNNTKVSRDDFEEIIKKIGNIHY